MAEAAALLLSIAESQMRAALPVTIALCLTAGSLTHGEKFTTVDKTCPICAQKYQARAHLISSSRGARLDLRPIGSTSPSPVPVCPKCGFIDFGDNEYPAEELKSLKAFVNSEDYKKLVKDGETPHFRMARLFAHLKRDPLQIGFAYLKATWEAEGEKGRETRYLEECLRAYDAALAVKPTNKEGRDTAAYLRGELLRRLEKFDDAEAQFDELKKQKSFEEAPFAQLIGAQLELIGKKDSLPHPAPLGPDKD
jgi:tetratricopeptide (TPR) repeat protein